MEWEFKDGVPIYTQIIKQLQVNIAKGVYQPGEKIPSVRELAVEASVNPNTMQRALTELERDGLVYSVRTSGRFITDEEETLNYLKQTLANTHTRDFIKNLSDLGFNKKEMITAVESYKEED